MTDLTERNDELVVFKLQIVRRNGDAVVFNGGGRIEADLIKELSRIVSTKIQLFSTKSKRETIVEESLTEVFEALKKKTVGA